MMKENKAKWLAGGQLITSTEADEGIFVMVRGKQGWTKGRETPGRGGWVELKKILPRIE